MNDTNYQSSVKKRENLNGTISVTEIEFVVKNFSTKKIPVNTEFVIFFP